MNAKPRDCTNWCKSIWSSIKRKSVQDGPVFSKKKGQVVFRFQHFVKPEQIIEEYTRVNIYNKPRLVKIPKKETSEKSASSDVDFHRCKSKPDTKYERRRTDADSSEKKTSRWRLNKSTESVPKKVRRTPKRIPATHNFVYEFHPFGNLTPAFDSKSTSKGLQNLCNIGEGDTSIKQNSSNVKVYTAAALPKLQSHCDSVQSNVKKQKDPTNCNKNTNLPNIKRQEGGMDQGLSRNCSETRKRSPMDEIDREVEKVKSDWQMQRTGNHWTRGKALNPNPRTKNLYETLERMTREISKIEKSYQNPKSNQFLQRASKALDVPQPSFEDEATKIRDVLFPKANPREKMTNRKIADETLSSIPSDALRKILLREASAENVTTNKQLDARSLIANPRARNMRNLLKAGKHLSLKFDKRNKSEIRLKSSLLNDQRTSKEMSADIERYLEEYIDNAEKNFANEKESKAKDSYPSPGDMTEMLKRLNLESFDMYDGADSREDSEKDFSSNSVKRVQSMKLENSLRAAMNSNTGGKPVCKETATEYVSPKRYDDSMQENNGLYLDTSIQTNKFPSQSNTFIGMGFGALNTNIPKSKLSRILQSDYLKKDVSLKPM